MTINLLIPIIIHNILFLIGINTTNCTEIKSFVATSTQQLVKYPKFLLWRYAQGNRQQATGEYKRVSASINGKHSAISGQLSAF
ncbi:MAG: hypothetical protein SWX82_27730 [Cyanobacteriota bacterium]|nr:hypothetical protein [Cyanobacteriota bacterium]